MRLLRGKVPVVLDPAPIASRSARRAQLRDGKDVGIISTGLMTERALDAAAALARRGIAAGVLHVPTIKPFDAEAVAEFAASVDRVVTAENHVVRRRARRASSSRRCSTRRGQAADAHRPARPLHRMRRRQQSAGSLRHLHAAPGRSGRAGDTAQLMPPRTAAARTFSLFAVSEVGVLCALVLAVAFFSALEPAFLSERNIRAILNVVSFVGIIAIGQTMLLVAGEFDLSVGSVAGLSAVVAAKLMTALALPVPVALLVRRRWSAAWSAWSTASSSSGCSIPAFIQTLGMLFIGQGLIQVVTNGYPVYPLPPVSRRHRPGVRSVFGLGWSFVFFIVAAIVGRLRAAPHRRSAATCTRPAATPKWRASSASTPPSTRSAPSSLVGVLAAIAGMFVMADLASGTTSIGSGWELTVIAGVVVGGVSLFGGAGTMAGGIVGILLLQVVQSGLVVIGVNSNWQQIAVGVIMVLAVGLDILRRRYFIAGAGAPQPARDRTARPARTPALAETNPSDDDPRRRLTELVMRRAAARSRPCSLRRSAASGSQAPGQVSAALGAADEGPSGAPADAGGLPR